LKDNTNFVCADLLKKGQKNNIYQAYKFKLIIE